MNDVTSFAIVLSLKSDETMLCFFFGMDRSVFDKNSIQRKYFKNIKLSGKNFQVLDYLRRFYIFVDTINNELSMNFQGRFRITEILRQLQKLSFP